MPTDTERAIDLARLDATRLAVLVTRGPEDDGETLDGILELDTETLTPGWAALIEGTSNYDPFYESLTQWIPDTSQELVTTEDGEVFVSGTGIETYTSESFPSWEQYFFWMMRLDPSDGSRLWVSETVTLDQYGFEGAFGLQMVINGHDHRVLLKGMVYPEYFGADCFWADIDWSLGGDPMVSDFSLDSDDLYCHRATVSSDGRVMAPVEEHHAPTNQLHVAEGDGVAHHPLEGTDIPHAHVIYLDHDDETYVIGQLGEDWGDDGVNRGLARLSLDPPSTDVLTTWAWDSSEDTVRDVAFGMAGEVLTLRRTPGGTVVEQRTMD